MGTNYYTNTIYNNNYNLTEYMLLLPLKHQYQFVYLKQIGIEDSDSPQILG